MDNSDTHDENSTDHEQPQRLATKLRDVADEVERIGRQAGTDDINCTILDGEATITAGYDLTESYDISEDPDNLTEPEVVPDGGENEDQSLTETILATIEAIRKDRKRPGASVGDVITNILDRTPHSLNEVCDELSRLHANGEIYQPNDTSINLVELRTDGGTDGAIDHEFDDAEKTASDRLHEELAEAGAPPHAKLGADDIAIDLVTRQALVIIEQTADTLVEYYEEEDFDLQNYKQHPWLPVRPDDPVYKCVFIGGLDDLHSFSDTYDYPAGRLARVPVELAGGNDDA